MCLFLETLRIAQGQICHLEYHHARMEWTHRAAFGERCAIHLPEWITPPPSGVYRCSVVYGKEVESVQITPYTPRIFSKLALVHSDIDYDALKYADRSALESLRETAPGCDDVIIVREGLVRDTTIANIAIWENERWLTPEVPLLRGTTRARLIEEGVLFSASITPQRLHKAPKIAPMNALMGFRELVGVEIRGLAS